MHNTKPDFKTQKIIKKNPGKLFTGIVFIGISVVGTLLIVSANSI